MKIYRHIALTLFVLVSGCSKHQYRADEVVIHAEGFTDSGIQLWFETPPETLYYCPGVLLEYNGPEVQFWFVRSHINQSPKVDAKTEYRDKKAYVVIPLHPDEDSIDLIDSSSTSLGSWHHSSSNPSSVNKTVNETGTVRRDD